MDQPQQAGATPPTAAVYAQYAPGTSVFLVGSREGLAALREAISAVLAGTDSHVQLTFVSDPDGNPNAVVVALQDAAALAKLASPAADPAFAGHGVRPEDLPQVAAYLVDHQRRAAAQRRGAA